MKVLVDANVIIDVLQGRDPFGVSSGECLSLFVKAKVRPLVSAHCVTTIWYLQSKKGVLTGISAVDFILANFDIAPVDREILTDAQELSMRDFEDAVTAAAANRAGATLIITRDLGDFECSPVPAMDPDDFLKTQDYA